MAVRTMPVPLDAGTAACADPEQLPLVDAAFAKPGGPEARSMQRNLCRHCPVVEQCLAWAMTHGERGVWGGMTPIVRHKHGAPSALPTVPRALHAG